MKRTLALILTLILCLSLTACGDNSSDSSNNDTTTSYSSYDSDTSSDSVYAVSSENEAIQLVKSGDGSLDAASLIADALGFKQYYEPSWGTCSASQDHSDGSWDVILKGKISGYTDDYNNNFDSKTFTFKVTVFANGNVAWLTSVTY